MIAVMAVPLLLSACLGLSGRAVARRLHPRRAALLLCAVSLSSALCTGVVLSAVAVLVCARIDHPAPPGWSPDTAAVPTLLGLGALLVTAVLLSRGLVCAARGYRDLRSAGRIAGLFTPAAGDLVIIEDDASVAYAVAGLRRSSCRIVVSTGMLRSLTAQQQLVLLAHERSHLRHRHHLYLHVVRVAAAANPLVGPLAAAVETAVERWADEDAATAVGDRPATARALAQAALGHVGLGPRLGLAAAEHSVVHRVRALLEPTISRRWAAVLLLAIATACWASAASITAWTHAILELTETSTWPA